MRTILAIDIGSAKTAAVIANYESQSNELSISGVGITNSKGIKRGTIVNIENAAKSIKEAYLDAKRIAGVDIKKAIISVSTSYTKSIISFGIVNIPGNEIKIKEVNRAIQLALHNANMPKDYTVLQAIPYNFKVDDLSEIEDPLGMSGSRLEVSVHIIAIQKSGLENIKKTIAQAGLEIENLVSSPYASGLSTLKEDEKELGVAIIDIGATTSDLGIFTNKSFRYTNTLGVGSHHITNDLSIALHTPITDAELIKLNFEKLVKNEEELIDISVIGNENEKQKASLEAITQIMSARIEETFLLLRKEIEDSGLKNKIGTGIVITGGFTNFYNAREIASQFFEGLPVRIGIPKEIGGLFENLKRPEFSCVLGLVLYGIREGINYEIDSNNKFVAKTLEEDMEEMEIKFNDEEENETEKESVPPFIPPRQKNGEEVGLIQKFRTWLANLF